MASMLRAPEVILGIIVVVYILNDVFQSVVVPRPTPARYRLTRWIVRPGWPRHDRPGDQLPILALWILPAARDPDRDARRPGRRAAVRGQPARGDGEAWNGRRLAAAIRRLGEMGSRGAG